MAEILTRRDRMYKVLAFEEVDRVPRHLWALPGVTHDRPQEMQAFRERFPQDDISGVPAILAASGRASGDPNRRGTYTDDWGCVWDVLEDGIIGEIKKPILADDALLDAYVPPFEITDNADISPVAPYRAEHPDEFLLMGGINFFERMQYLRGTEQLFIDLAMDDPIAYKLRDMVHEYNLRVFRLMAQCDVDAISIFDDWGSQRSLLISPEMWRAFFKPCYREYCDIICSSGKKVFFHSDGFIEAIYPDFIEMGVNALNSQLFCMDMEKLGREYADKIVFWGEIDRQYLMPFGTPDEIRAGVRRAAKALMPHGKRTGVVAQCEWGIKDPLENVLAVYDEWDKV